MIKNLTIFLIVLLFSCADAPKKIDYNQKADHRILFVGNSFTFYNKLNLLVAQLVYRLEKKKVYTVRISTGGYTSHDHFQDLHLNDTAINKVFVQDLAQGKKWNLLVLQENSRIPGLLKNGATSRIPEIQLDYGKNVAKKTMLLMTWGYLHGDPQNKNVYPDYLTMQKKLALGTRFLAKEIRDKGSEASVVPAGLGFQTVYEDLQKEGKDPLAKNSLFRKLYIDDGMHPSLAGSYLTACIIASLYTKKSILTIDGKPKKLDAEFAKYLREVAARVVENEKAFPIPN